MGQLNGFLSLPVFILFGSSFSYALIQTLVAAIDIIRSKVLSDSSYSRIDMTTLLKLSIICMACSFGGGIGIVYGLSIGDPIQ